jgi:uncharacterized protein (TIGR02246 family)
MVAVERPLPATPEDAETAFYTAFEHGDLQAMMTVWAEDETIVCVHPLGPLLIGRKAIQHSWKTIFARSVNMKFTIDRQLRTVDDSVAVHIVYEHIELPGQQRRQAVIATNAYRRTHSGWYMILHHASPTTVAEGAGTTILH